MLRFNKKNDFISIKCWKIIYEKEKKINKNPNLTNLKVNKSVFAFFLIFY